MPGFSERMWARIGGLYEAILEHPFNRELAVGTLSRERFERYVIQDSIYLDAFSRALAVASARADTREDRSAFARLASESLEVERELHARLSEQLGIDPRRLRCAEPSPACSHYCSYLLATAYQEPVPVLVAALLPCFWIYWEVGKDIRRRSAAGNPYARWVETYAGEEYAGVVREVIVLADRLAEEAADRSAGDRGTRPDVSPTRRPSEVGPASAGGASLQAMEAAFCRASQLEWLFWDDAYRGTEWPSLGQGSEIHRG